MSDLKKLHHITEQRRSIYALSNQLPVSNDKVVEIIEHAILHTPSSFNSQSTRIIVLFADEHQKLWQITEDILRDIVNDEEQFVSTKQKMDSFKAAAGTVLFFEDNNVVKGMQEDFPLYADRFPVYAQHTNAMHQYAVWTALATVNIGASLQHYNPVIDDKVTKTWDVDSDWELTSQLVFGAIEQPAGKKEFKPLEDRLKVFG